MIITAAVILIAFGALCLFDKNTAWMLYEYDARLMGKVLQRSEAWNNLLNTQGFVLILVGLIGVVISLR
jgi:hypothetical protein